MLASHFVMIPKDSNALLKYKYVSMTIPAAFV
jgi:hypothetical protein